MTSLDSCNFLGSELLPAVGATPAVVPFLGIFPLIAFFNCADAISYSYGLISYLWIIECYFKLMVLNLEISSHYRLLSFQFLLYLADWGLKQNNLLTL